MIHVLTLTWNGLDHLLNLTPGLWASLGETGHDAMWYVRDNGSTDGTIKYLHAWNDSLDIEVLKVGHNRQNFAQGVNSLYDRVRANKELDDDDYLLLLNNDIIFGDDKSLAKMMNLMQDPKIAVVGSRLLYSSFPEKRSNKLQHAGVIFGPRYGNMPYHYRHGEESTKETECNRYFQAVTAACCLVRAKDFVRMDELFHWAFEDIDMCLRIGKTGKKIAYCGDTKIYHEESATLKKNPVNKMFMQPNVKHFKEKWMGKYDLDHEKYLANPMYKVF